MTNSWHPSSEKGSRTIWYDRYGKPISQSERKTADKKVVPVSPTTKEEDKSCYSTSSLDEAPVAPAGKLCSDLSCEGDFGLDESQNRQSQNEISQNLLESESVIKSIHQPSRNVSPQEGKVAPNFDSTLSNDVATEYANISIAKERYSDTSSSFSLSSEASSVLESSDTSGEYYQESRTPKPLGKGDRKNIISHKGIVKYVSRYLIPVLLVAISGGYLLSNYSESSTLPIYDLDAFEKRIPYHYLGSFNRDFNDLNDLQLSAARKIGIQPANTRRELKQNRGLVGVSESPVLSIDNLTHSQALLVPEAAVLLNEIGTRFSERLLNDGMPIYSIIVTSVTRTAEDVTRLRTQNGNASQNSTHAYGTTFDISWKRFHKCDLQDPRSIDPEELKHLLADILSEFHKAGRCYIKHERYQACFHITTIK